MSHGCFGSSAALALARLRRRHAAAAARGRHNPPASRGVQSQSEAMEQYLPTVKGLSARTPADKAAAQRADGETHARLHRLARLPGNRECADCTATLTYVACGP